MQKLIYILPLALITLCITACDETLSESELKVIEKNLPAKIYAENIAGRVESVYDYLWDAVDVYADQLCNQTQSDVDKYNSTSALFGGSLFDFNELFGSSAPEQYAKRYYRFIDYVNNHNDDYTQDMKTICNVLMKHPEVVNNFFSESSTISLNSFESIEGLPSTITSDEFKKYLNLELNKSNRAKWGELVMGSLKQPRYSPLALVCASVIRIERLKYPKPVYAVYKEGEDFDDEDGWEVGYDTKQAYFVTFNEDEDVLEYTYDEVDYFDGYVQSKKNKLK